MGVKDLSFPTLVAVEPSWTLLPAGGLTVNSLALSLRCFNFTHLQLDLIVLC